MKIQRYLWVFTLFFSSGSLLAGLTTLDFNYLNSSLNNNSLMVGISNTGVIVTGVPSGNNFLYSIMYVNADFNEDNVKDTLSFDLLVEGYNNGTATYNEEDFMSSATIGTSEAVSIVSGTPEKGWTIGDDMGMGKSLRFTISNISSSVGSVEFNGINVLHLVEDGGHSHASVIGEGTGLDAFIFNQETDEMTWILGATDPVLITGASTGNSANWGVSSLDLRMSVSVGDAMSAEDFNNVFPILAESVSWDWGTPRTMRQSYSRRGNLSDDDIHDIGLASGGYLSIHPDNDVYDKFYDWYPDKIYGGPYMNLGLYFDDNIPEQHPEWFLYGPDDTEHTNAIYWNLKIPECRAYWMAEARIEIDEFTAPVKEFFIDAFAKPIQATYDDGEFLDYWGNEIGEEFWTEGIDPLLNAVRDEFGDEVVITANIWRVADALRETRVRYAIEYSHIAYVEGWEGGGAETTNISIQDAQVMTTSGLGFLINLESTAPNTRTVPLTTEEMITKAQEAMPELWDILPEDEQLELAEKYAYFDVKMAYILMFAEKYTYFDFDVAPTQLTDMGTDNWKMVLPFPEWDMPLGEPLGLAIQDGNIWTRSFEFVDVTLDLNNGTAEYSPRNITNLESVTPQEMELQYNLIDNMLIVNSLENTNTNIEMFNVNGQSIASQNGSSGELILDLNSVNTGVYMIRVWTANQVMTEKILVK